MRVLVIGSGGREQAIAWACRRHGHETTLLAELPARESEQPDLVIPGPEASLVAGVADEIWFGVRDVSDLQAPPFETGTVVCNPPYDERLAADTTLYRKLKKYGLR